MSAPDPYSLIPKRERIALHEAAHGYVAMRLGYTVREIRVEETNGRVTGHVIADPPELDDEKELAWRSLVYTIAGRVAEAILFGVSARLAVLDSIEQGTQDGEAMVEWLTALTPDADERRELLFQATDEIEEKLREEWTEVRRIASAVNEHGVCHVRAVA